MQIEIEVTRGSFYLRIGERAWFLCRDALTGKLSLTGPNTRL